jgi:hypothetical protein
MLEATLIDGKFFLTNHVLIVFSDASFHGCGDVCDVIGSWGHGLGRQITHINEIKLLGALFALQVYTASSTNISIHILLNNSTAVAYINKCGETRSLTLIEIAVLWCRVLNIYVFSPHLPGNSNIVADEESRVL